MRWFLLLFVVALGGCAGVAPVVQRAADSYDESLVAAELWVCRGASVGSVVRHYGRDDATWAAWRRLCGYSGTEAARPQPHE